MPGTETLDLRTSTRIETIDIMPTLAALIGLPVPAGEIDGQCRDLDAGQASTCPTQ